MDQKVKYVGKYSLKKEFNTTEEFNKYYFKHKDEIDAKSTNQLNKEYKINGFKITKRNMKVVDGKRTGELFLKPDTKCQETKSQGTKCQYAEQQCVNEDKANDEMQRQLSHEIEELKTKINILTESYGHIVDVINSLTAVANVDQQS